MTFSPATIERIRELKRRYPSPRSAILPALWAVQHERGSITADGMELVARELDMPPSIVEGTASFYSMYFRKPPGRHLVVVCLNVSCALRGCAEIVQAFEQALEIEAGETSADGAVTLQSTPECLGGCGGAPAIQVNHRFREHMTAEKAHQLVAELRALPAGTVH